MRTSNRITISNSARGKILRFEPLEDRRLLATYTVNSIADDPVAMAGDAPGTLRQAIFDANANPGTDDVVFSLPPASTITLDEGQLAVTQSINIIGPGAAMLTIDASGNDATPDDDDGNGSRIFELSAVDTTISGLTFTGGDEDEVGGAIWAAGSLEIADSVFIDNAAIAGGAIFASDGTTLEIVNTRLEANHASISGGAIYGEARTSTTISGSQIINNVAGDQSGVGGGVAIEGGDEIEPTDLLIELTLIQGNSAPRGAGGGVYYDTGDTGIGTFEMHQCRITDNLGDDGLRWAEVGPPDPVIERGGGGVFANTVGTVVITDSTVDNNISYGRGGGLDFEDSESTIINTTISGNQSMEGGGVWASNALIRHSTITLNRAGIRPEVMITEPSTTGGGGLNIGGWEPGATAGTVLDHTIVAGNFHECDLEDEWLLCWPREDYESPDIGFSYPLGLPSPPVTLLASYTFIGTPQGALSETFDTNPGIDLVLSGVGNQFGDPLLGPLADNGGFTLPDGNRIVTHALLEGSTAIDRGDPSIQPPPPATDPEFDERGGPYVRVYDAIPGIAADIDIGAFELQPIVPDPCPPGDYNDDGITDAADYVIWRKLDGLAVVLPNDVTPGAVDDGDYDVWVENFAEICEQPLGEVSASSGSNDFIPIVSQTGSFDSLMVYSSYELSRPAEQHIIGEGSQAATASPIVRSDFRSASTQWLLSLPIPAAARDEAVNAAFAALYDERGDGRTDEVDLKFIDEALLELAVDEYFEQPSSRE